MTVIHTLSGFATGGVSGTQATQRDWSPYLVHFTQYAAMAPLRSAVSDGLTPSQVLAALQEADSLSLGVVREIHASNRLRANSPSMKNGIPSCVCLSECNLAGLVSHSERFGRFGFVFEKAAIYGLGGGPCLYVSDSEYAELVLAFRSAPPGPRQNIFGRANVYRPPGAGQVQDFTHEREWRVFGDIDLRVTPPCFLLAPRASIGIVQPLFPRAPAMPLDTLFQWGA